LTIIDRICFYLNKRDRTVESKIYFNKMTATSHNKKENQKKDIKKTIRYIDLFCGIGGFRIAIEQVAQELDIAVKCV